ncbi:MAG: tetratricopeptide repeat protein [Bacteroidetes bacterium HGW-Bacteroidetes-22]|nr:MAG: tetratricopeptide repeat protein [Bacteroidetes bacterium HGW-Bacteroidetes-22]
MKKLLSIAFIVLFTNLIFGQDFYSDFAKFQESNDTLNQLKTLKAWEKTNPTDAELYTSYFNYYFAKSRTEMLTLTTEQPDGQVLILTDSTNKTAGYIGSQVDYAQLDLKKGIDWMNKGIEQYPDRLDMRFGKIYVLGQIKDWDNFTKEIIVAVQYSKINNNNWTWTNNETQNGIKDIFINSLQDYQVQLFNTGDDKLLINMSDIANEILKLYPDHVMSLSNLSIVYMISKDYDKALDVLIKAEKISPEDYIVLSNIANCYKENGDKIKSLEYYEKTIKYGDEQAKEYAKKQIEELKK